MLTYELESNIFYLINIIIVFLKVTGIRVHYKSEKVSAMV